MDFPKALEQIFAGRRMTRIGWQSNGNAEDEPQTFVFCVAGSRFQVNRRPLLEAFTDGTWISYHAHIEIAYPDGSVAVYTPSQVDLFAGDWEIVP